MNSILQQKIDEHVNDIDLPRYVINLENTTGSVDVPDNVHLFLRDCADVTINSTGKDVLVTINKAKSVTVNRAEGATLVFTDIDNCVFKDTLKKAKIKMAMCKVTAFTFEKNSVEAYDCDFSSSNPEHKDCTGEYWRCGFRDYYMRENSNENFYGCGFHYAYMYNSTSTQSDCGMDCIFVRDSSNLTHIHTDTATYGPEVSGGSTAKFINCKDDLTVHALGASSSTILIENCDVKTLIDVNECDLTMNGVLVPGNVTMNKSKISLSGVEFRSAVEINGESTAIILDSEFRSTFKMPDSGCTSRIDNLTVMGEMTAGGTMEISNSNIRGNFDFSTGKTYVGRFNSYRGNFTAKGLKGFNKTKRDSSTGTVKFEGAGSESFLDWLFSSGQEVEIKDFANLKAEGIGSKSKIENIKFAEIKSGESELKNICHAVVDGGKYKATDSLVLCKGGSVEATNTIVINAGGALDESSSNALSIEKGYRIYAKDIQLTVESNVELNCKAPVINVLGEMKVYIQSPDITLDCPMVTFTGDFNTPSVPSYNGHVHPGVTIGEDSTLPPI